MDSLLLFCKCTFYCYGLLLQVATAAGASFVFERAKNAVVNTRFCLFQYGAAA
jgi:hypothetical protein